MKGERLYSTQNARYWQLYTSTGIKPNLFIKRLNTRHGFQYSVNLNLIIIYTTFKPSSTKMTLTSNEVSRYQTEVLSIVNRIRRRASLGTVIMNSTLTECARCHTYDQRDNLGHISHTGSDTSSLGDRVRRAGYHHSYANENVASGQRDADHVMTSLMNSPGHRQNILAGQPNEMGLYVAENRNGTKFWTQIFGKQSEKRRVHRNQGGRRRRCQRLSHH